MQPQQDVPTAKLRAPKPECLARQPLDQIACHCARRKLLADNQAQSRLVACWLAIQDKVRGPAPRAQTKTDEYSSVFSSLAALGNAALARN